jgi:RluA family pseudouridine synthase
MKIKVTGRISLIDFLIKNYPDTPRNRIKKWLQNGCIQYNNRVITKASSMLSPETEIEINTNSAGKELSKSSFPFPILFEDQYIFAVEKPAGIPSVGDLNTPNIFKMASAYLKEKNKGKLSVFVVHRLDKEVSGVLLFAKTFFAMNNIKDNWNENIKIYNAFVEGCPKEPEGVIKSWLKENSQMLVYSTNEQADAKLAITHYRILNKFEGHTLIEVRLETGRKNQIRVHLSDIGCPVVGDRKYGASDDFIRRIRLHACLLSLKHPVNGQQLKIESPLPKNFMVIKQQDENYKVY